MNRKRSKLVQVLVVSVVLIGLLIAAGPGVAQNERPPLQSELQQFLEKRTREPESPLHRYLKVSDSEARSAVASFPFGAAFARPSQPADEWAPNSAYAFADYNPGNFEIYTRPSYTGPVQRVTDNAAYDLMPKLNRGSTRMTFISDRDGNNEVYVMNADGSGQTRLTWTSTNEYLPNWSPDGSKIVFYSYRDGNAEIYSMNSDGTQQTRLTTNPAWDGHPAWSPDGSQLVFASDRSGTQELWLMNSDGSNPHMLTPHLGYAAYPDWSPDGSRIAFSADPDADTWLTIALINADGTGLRHFASVPSPYSDYVFPAWSPNGRALAIGIVHWIIYKGNYYWDWAGIINFDVDLVTSQPTVCAAGLWTDATCWYPDWETTDAVPPSSHVEALPPWQNTLYFTVRWSGSDAGSGLTTYDIQYRDGLNGSWTDWRTATEEPSLLFAGEYGHTYYFRSRARDYAGNLEAYPSMPDAMTTIYQHAASGRVLDNREQPVAVVNVQPNPAALNTGVSRHDGAYDLYFASSSVYTLTTTRSNFGQLPPQFNVTVPSSNSLPTLYLPPLDNQINDSHFESGNFAAWTPSGVLTPVITSTAHTGNYAALLGGSAPTGTLVISPWHSAIEQTINVSPTVVSGTLSLLYRVDAVDPLSDTLNAYLVGASNALTFTLPVTTSGWTHAWFDLSAWTEPTATVKFDFSVADSGREAILILDEITWGSAIEGSHSIFLPITRR